jgi:hypothetical protein
MGDINNPNENNNGQPNSQNNDQQNQQPGYDQNQNQQSNPYQQPGYNQPQNQQAQYQQPQYGGQSQYQQNDQQSQQNGYQQNPYQQNPYQQYSQYPQPQKKDNGMAIASLICGIVSVVLGCCVWYITLPVSIVGLVLGILVLNKKKDGRTMAIVGIVLCAFGILIGILGIIGTVAIINGGDSFMNDFYGDFNWEDYY